MTELNIDLNLNHYDIKELESLLNMDEGYTFIDITKKANRLRERIFSLTNINIIKKQEIEIFLKDVVGNLERNMINNKLDCILLLFKDTRINK
jgi:hypothetical protein